ncbi:MAG: hypothetical protein Q8N14_06685 [Candidatus Omnitrophota bacterium]|nr:hypothetical protein [Candidatus Omnitrophota bacterium]
MRPYNLLILVFLCIPEKSLPCRQAGAEAHTVVCYLRGEGG